MEKVLKRIGLFLLVALTVIVVLGISQKKIYRVFSTDYNRHAVVNDVIDRSNREESILVFGDSRTMFGLDTRIIKEVNHYPFEVYNLGTASQNIYESAYYYGQLNGKIKQVIQCTSPAFFSEDMKPSLPDSKAISMFLSGYVMSQESALLVEGINPFFEKTELTKLYESRSYFKSYFHNLIRPIFDNEHFDDALRSSEYFPHIYTKNRHPNYPEYKVGCDEYSSKQKPVSQLAFLKKVKQFFDGKGITYTLVLMPVNPDACKDAYPDFVLYEKEIEAATGIHVINLSNLILDPRYFYDAVHPNKEGAKIVSNALASELLKP